MFEDCRKYGYKFSNKEEKSRRRDAAYYDDDSESEEDNQEIEKLVKGLKLSKNISKVKSNKIKNIKVIPI